MVVTWCIVAFFCPVSCNELVLTWELIEMLICYGLHNRVPMHCNVLPLHFNTSARSYAAFIS